MSIESFAERVVRLEERVTRLEELPQRIDDLALQISQFRSETHAEFSAIRSEVAAEFVTVRREIVELRVHMSVLHEETLSRIATLGEALNARRQKKPRREH